MDGTMLIVDDMEVNRDVLKLLFEEEYAVLEAESGKEALAILERCQGNVDVVLLDLMMPGMTGFEVLEKRKEMEYFKDIPVVVISSSGELEDQLRAFDLGASDYVNKPFVPEIVLSRINNVMASHRRMLSIEMEAQKLKIQSELDQMTGLLNKTTSELTIEQTLNQADQKLHALFIIDIDNFKSVNDTSGHLAGDHVIRIIADLISSLFRKTDIVGRIGGDEFIAMMVDVPSMDIVRTKVNELIQIMKYKPNLTIPENVTLSIGIASNERKKTTYQELVARADEALYLAKQGGKARYREYGVEENSLSEDIRPTVLLISRDRGICSIVHAFVPESVRVVEAIEVDELQYVKKEDIEKLSIVYVDVTDENSDEIWQAIRKYEWIDFKNVLAICQEGNMVQFRQALEYGAADILTAPLDGNAFKRRTLKQLEQFGITRS